MVNLRRSIYATGKPRYADGPLRSPVLKLLENLAHVKRERARCTTRSTPRPEATRRGREERISLQRVLSSFSGPIIWAFEIAAVLLILLTHSVDFVGVVIIANLVMILMMMASGVGLGLRHDGSFATALESLNRRPHNSARLYHNR